jgi:hypothetical protein
MNLAARAALVLSIEPRANWVFRMTEDDASRGAQLSRVVHTVVWLDVAMPLVALFPVEGALLGPCAIGCMSIAFLCGLVLVELHMGSGLHSVHLLVCAWKAVRRSHHNHRLRRVRYVHDESATASSGTALDTEPVGSS